MIVGNTYGAPVEDNVLVTLSPHELERTVALLRAGFDALEPEQIPDFAAIYREWESIERSQLL